MKTRAAAGLALLLVMAATATSSAAQDVGYLPAQSPYRDLNHRQEITGFAGYYRAATDPAGVAPTSGPMASVRYEIRLGGPAQFYASLAGVRSDRTVLDPSKAPDERKLGVQDVNLVLADLGISMNLTGQKSWHNVVPVLAAGLGIASDLTTRDPGGFRLGTPFALSFGGGLKWISGDRVAMRADVTDHMFQVRYPNSYFQAPASGIPAVLEPTAKQNVWTHNAALTLGISYRFGR